MARQAIVPFRWVGRGIDIRVAGNATRPLFAALDICAAFGIHVEQGEVDWMTELPAIVFPLPTEQLEGAFERDGRPVEVFDVDQVRELAGGRPMVLAFEFMEWLEQLLGALPPEQLEQVFAAALPAEPGRAEAIAYDVVDAARILSRDPALSYGQQSLFKAMDAIGWISKEASIWVPSTGALQAGFLVRRNRYLDGPKTTYPQIRITASGLAELHRRLGGAAALNVDPQPAPALLEL